MKFKTIRVTITSHMMHQMPCALPVQLGMCVKYIIIATNTSIAHSSFNIVHDFNRPSYVILL